MGQEYEHWTMPRPIILYLCTELTKWSKADLGFSLQRLILDGPNRLQMLAASEKDHKS